MPVSSRLPPSRFVSTSSSAKYEPSLLLTLRWTELVQPFLSRHLFTLVLSLWNYPSL